MRAVQPTTSDTINSIKFGNQSNTYQERLVSRLAALYRLLSVNRSQTMRVQPIVNPMDTSVMYMHKLLLMKV